MQVVFYKQNQECIFLSFPEEFLTLIEQVLYEMLPNWNGPVNGQTFNIGKNFFKILKSKINNPDFQEDVDDIIRESPDSICISWK